MPVVWGLPNVVELTIIEEELFVSSPYKPVASTAVAQAAAGGGTSRANSKLAPSMARPNLFSGD